MSSPLPAKPVTASDCYVRPPTASVICVGELGNTGKISYFGQGMRAKGWDVVEIESTAFLGGSGNKYIDAIARKINYQTGTNRLEQYIWTVAEAMGPDFVFFSKTFGATPGLIDYLHSINTKAVCWYPDVDFNHPNVDIRTFPMFDLFVTTKEFHLPYLEGVRQGKPSMLLEHGYSPNCNKRLSPPFPAEERPFDCVFMGNHSQYKEDCLREIMERQPHLSYCIIGGRWHKLPWLSKYKVFCTTTGLTGDAMSRLINHSRVALALHHGPTNNPYGWQDDVSARTFEIPACGTFMLHVDNAHIRTLYDVPGEIDTFTDAAEAADKLAYYLAHPEEREAKADRAYNRAVPAYSYSARSADLADAMMALLEK